MLLFALLLSATLNAGEPVRIEGTVTFDDAPLPGATVRITSSSLTRTTITSADGRYAFDALPPGTYHLTYELAGLESAEKRVTVETGTEDVSAALTFNRAEEIILSCGAPCIDAPESEWDRPACTDYDLDTALIEALERGDRSARDLLRQRFETTFTYNERHRIATALLRRVDDDSRYWKELVRHASIAVKFPQVDHEWTPEFVAWCAERSLDPEDYWYMAVGALSDASGDPRSRPLLLSALETDDEYLISTAAWGLAGQRDESFLPAIDAALKRKSEDDSSLVLALVLFTSAAADEIAMKYLDDEDERADYAEQRAEYAEQRAVAEAMPRR